MHLKCNYNDLPTTSLSCFTYEPTIESIESYAECNISDTAYKITNDESIEDDGGGGRGGGGGGGGIKTKNEDIGNANNNDTNLEISTNCTNYNYIVTTTTPTTTVIHPKSQTRANSNNNNNNKNDANLNSAIIDLREIWKKINRLKVIFHKDGAHHAATQRSACFWCTYEFETPTIHIPTLYNKTSNAYNVYGCFCSPECATAHLMKELIDTSVRFERFHLLHAMYSKIYNYDTPFKPAPDPHYLLNKFYGQLSIEEYRKLLKSDHMLYIVNKPLLHSLPELYEDNNEFMVSNKITIQSRK
jgi:hypothetical protein